MGLKVGVAVFKGPLAWGLRTTIEYIRYALYIIKEEYMFFGGDDDVIELQHPLRTPTLTSYGVQDPKHPPSTCCTEALDTRVSRGK